MVSPADCGMSAWTVRDVLRSPVWPWLLVSGIVHALIAMLAVGALGAGLLIEGRGTEDGDGFAGQSIELEIRGPEDGLPTGSTASRTAAPPPTQSAPELEEPEPGAEDVAEDGTPAVVVEEGSIPVPAAPRARPRPVPAELAAGSSAAPAEGGVEGAGESSPGVGEVSGTGGDESTAGAPAGDPGALILGSAGIGGDTVSARRLLLPNGGACEDPVAGRWRAQKYRGTDHSWVRFTLRIHREGRALHGTIESRIWNGSATDPRPGECTAFGGDHTWRMQARGAIEGTSVRFEARSARLVAEHCPQRGTRYAPDRFRGTVEPLREVFDAVNNDGAFDLDEPYMFRRVSCDP